MLEVLLFFILAVVIGLMYTFFGYALFRFLLPIWAFFVGLLFGFRGIEELMGAGFISASLGIIIGLVIGVVLAAVSYMVYSLAVYIFGITVGYALGAGMMYAFGFEPGIMTFLVGVVVAIGLTLLFMRGSMPKLVIMFFTAAAGAMGVMTGLFVLFGRVPLLGDSLEITRYVVMDSWFWFLVWAVLAGFGFAFQYALAMQAEENVNDMFDWEMDQATVAGSNNA